jgi:ComF family protein
VDCVICNTPPKQICDRCAKTLPLKTRQVYRLGLPPGLACADYSKQIPTLVKEFKNQGSIELARVMAQSMAKALADDLAGTPTDRPHSVALVPAPSRPIANRQRGYKPAKLLASQVAVLLRAAGTTASVHDVLAAGRQVKDQAGLNSSERKQNLAGHMRLDSGVSLRLEQQRLVLIDDVVTTGATLLEMSRVLGEAGLRPDRFLTFAEAL